VTAETARLRDGVAIADHGHRGLVSLVVRSPRTLFGGGCRIVTASS
jgi:hypothetical protein